MMRRRVLAATFIAALFLAAAPRSVSAQNTALRAEVEALKARVTALAADVRALVVSPVATGTSVAAESLTGTIAWAVQGNITRLGTVTSGNVNAILSARLTDIAALAVTDSNIIVGNGSTWVAESGATARTSLGLAIGADVQAYSAKLSAIAGLSDADNNIIVGSAGGWVAESGATARTSLGLGTGDSPQFTALTTAAESWVGPSSTTGIYFKGGNYGLGTATPDAFVQAIVGTTKEFEFATLSGSARKKVAFGLGATYGYIDAYDVGGAVALALSLNANRGNVLIGGVTNSASGQMSLIFESTPTPPSGLAANTAGLYAKNVAGTVRMFGIDEAEVTGALVMASGALTSGRVALVGTNGLIGDDADLTFVTDTLTVTKLKPTAPQVTAGSGTGVTVDDGGQVRRTVYKVTIDRTQFVAAAQTADVTVATLPAKARLVGIVADLTTPFACAVTCTTTTLSITVGKTAGGAEYLVSFDADAAVARFGLLDAELGASLARANAIQGGDLPSWTATTPVSLRLTSGTGNLGTGAATNLSQGSITLYLTAEVYQ